MPATTITPLTEWHYRPHNQPASSNKWNQASPNTTGNQIHLDLYHNGHIPHPFDDDNESKVQWVGDMDWEYKTTVVPSHNKHQNCYRELVFDGLDTFAHIYINGTLVLETNNSFVKYTISDHVPSSPFELLIVFQSALHAGRHLQSEHGQFVASNGESSRVHVRKPQYHYGWDWGPLLMTCGPWKPVKLVEYDVAHLGSLRNWYNFNSSLSQQQSTSVEVNALFDVNLAVDPNFLISECDPQSDDDDVLVLGSDLSFEAEVTDANGEHVHSFASPIYQSGPIQLNSFEITNPKLWWPRNRGDQHRYHVNIKLLYKQEVIDHLHQYLPIRHSQLVQEPLDKGTSFYFKINSVPIFMNGCNWIPSHSFHSDVTRQHYHDWLDLAASANFNMVRVWGGGIWENDWFYERCDELGLLVWQDFMFACGMYPGYSQFINNVKLEASQNLARLAKYACVVIYSGNNEDYQIAEGLDIDWETEFPARYIYENLLPELVDEFIGLQQVAYHRGSPYTPTSNGEYKPTSDPTAGDIHQWDVWHGSQQPYQNWDKLGGRFISEFGMLALPHPATLTKYITSQQHPQSRIMELHNKSIGFERRLPQYVMQNFRVDSNDLASWSYLTQIMQSDCLALAYRYWRRQWDKRNCGGAIVWQLNDCWPVTSWSVVDFDKVPKLAYYAIKRECQSVSVGMKRREHIVRQGDEPNDLDKQTPLHDFAARNYSVESWVVNTTTTSRRFRFQLEEFDVESGELIRSFGNSLSRSASLKSGANTTTDLAPDFHLRSWRSAVLVTLYDTDGGIVHSSSDWPQPIKNIQWPTSTKVEFQVDVSDQKWHVHFKTNNPVKGVNVGVDDKNADQSRLRFSDNGFDLFPGHAHDITISNVQGLDTSAITLRYID